MTTLSRLWPSIAARGSTPAVEIAAGVSTFLSVAYIFVVSPAILAESGIPVTTAFLATALSACLSTLAMGLWANLPFAVAPGLSMSSYFTFVVVKKLGFSWQQALASVFISGLFCFILTALPVRRQLISLLPDGLRRAITITIAAFVLAIALLIARMVTYPGNLIHIAAIDPALIATFGAGAVLSLALRRVPGGVALAVIGAAVIHDWAPVWTAGAALPVAVGRAGFSIAPLDFSGLLNGGFAASVLVFFILDFFEGVGEFIGLSANTSLQTAAGRLPNIERGLYVDSVGTMLGALLGSSSLIIFVESAVGIRAGGRTGLVAVVCSVLMAVAAWIGASHPVILGAVPAAAASGVLAYVAVALAADWFNNRPDSRTDRFDIAVAVTMVVLTILTFSLSLALAIGFATYAARGARPASNKALQASPALLGIIAALLGFAVVWQRIYGS